MIKNNNLINTISYTHIDLPITFPCTCIFQNIECGNFSANNGKTPKAGHFHNCIELTFIKNSEGTLILENDILPFHPGSYCFVPENVAHSINSKLSCDTSKISPDNSQAETETICFDPYLMFKDIFPENELEKLTVHFTDCHIISADSNPQLCFLLECIFSETSKKESFYEDSLKGLFLSLLTLIKREEQRDNTYESDYHWLFSALNYIRKNYYRKLNIARIAENCCNMSESHFRKRFGEVMHISPLDYINGYRIRIACQLISKDDKPINKIAQDVGYTTLSSFNRNFHAVLGCSPSEWRKKASLSRFPL